MALSDSMIEPDAATERPVAPAESPLRDTERQFQLLVQNATNYAMFLITPEGSIASWNEGARRILGHEEAEILGQPVAIIFTTEDRTSGVPKRELDTALRDGRASDIRWHQRKDGTRFWADGIMERLTSPTGVLEGFAKILRDATDDKQAEERERNHLTQIFEQLKEAQQRLESALSAGNIATWTFDVRSDRVVADTNLARLFSVDPEAAEGGELGVYLAAILPEDRPRVVSAIARAIESETHYDAEYRVVLPDGSHRWLAARGTIERDAEGQAISLPGVVVDITERVDRERRKRFFTDLMVNTRGQLDPEKILYETAKAVGEYTNADRALYAEIDDDVGKMSIRRDFVRADTGVPSSQGVFTLSIFGSPLLESLRAGNTTQVFDTEEDSRLTPDNRTAFRAARLRSFLAVPVHKAGRLIAILALHQAQPRAWTTEEAELLSAAIERTWLAVENARLFRETQVRAEHEMILNQISAAARGTLKPEEILQSAAILLGQGLHVDRCYFSRSDQTRDIVRVSTEWIREDSQLESFLGRPFRFSAYAANRESVYKTGHTHIVDDVNDYGPSDAAPLLAVKIRALLRVPIETGDQMTALSVVMAENPRQWSAAEVRLVENTAALVRSALESAHLRQRERNIAQQLQEALIPPPPTDLPGLALSSFYRPALGEAEVGGDFFDVFPIEEGCTALVVADLSGKGLAAASQVATVRNMLRYAVYASETLAQAITALHRTLVNYELLMGFATLFIGVYDEKNQLFTYVNCGQEPGLIWRSATGAVEQLSPTGPVLGGFGDGDYEERTVSLGAGDVVALFTDGLTEVGPTRKLQLEVDGVIGVLQDCCNRGYTATQHPRDIVDRLISGIDDFARGGVRDDIALLVGVVKTL